jgi:hypothetical protein
MIELPGHTPCQTHQWTLKFSGPSQHAALATEQLATFEDLKWRHRGTPAAPAGSEGHSIWALASSAPLDTDHAHAP